MFSLSESLEGCNTPESKLILLIDLFLEKKIDTEDFCDQYEQIWNFQLDEGMLSADRAQLMSDLFDVVTWYTSIIEDRLIYPGFKNEQQVFVAAKETREKLVKNLA